jgi:IS30 family transposase
MKRLAFEIRQEIEKLTKEGKSLEEISVIANVGKTTVRQEYARCGGKKYYTSVCSH